MQKLAEVLFIHKVTTVNLNFEKRSYRTENVRVTLLIFGDSIALITSANAASFLSIPAIWKTCQLETIIFRYCMLLFVAIVAETIDNSNGHVVLHREN